ECPLGPRRRQWPECPKGKARGQQRGPRLSRKGFPANDLGVGGVITASEPGWIGLLSGLSERRFHELVGGVRRAGADAATGGRPWALPVEDRVLMVAAYWRTDLTLRRIGPLFGVSKSAADRVIDRTAPFLALAPADRRHPLGTVLIAEGATALLVAIDTGTRLVAAVGARRPFAPTPYGTAARPEGPPGGLA
ncbi:transposase family protein, partial [Streptomyces sp. WAC06614]